jgi:putative Mn2+ efflux pump MntP
MPFLKALLIAISLAIDVFAVSTGIGMRQSDYRTRLRFGAAFVTAELSMLFIGMLLGKLVYALIGNFAGYLGFCALIAVGAYVIYESTQESHDDIDLAKGMGLVFSALAISLDSLGIGFSISFLKVPIEMTIILIIVCTIAATGLGFALGRRLGTHFAERAELAGGILLVATGVLFAVLKATGHD